MINLFLFYKTIYFDISISGMFDIWPVMNKCTVVAKREIFYAWPFGLAAWLCGLIFINRMQSDQTKDQLCAASNYIKSKRIKLWIFPEGTRRNTGEIHPFRKGAFHVAIDSQLPILPVVYSSYRSFLDDQHKRLNSGKVIISALPPIPTEGMCKSDLNMLMEHTYDVMNREYQRVTNEIHEELKLAQTHTKRVDIDRTLSRAEQVPFLLEEPNVFSQYSYTPSRKSVVSTSN